MKTLEAHLRTNLKKELKVNPIDILNEDLVLEILDISENNSLDEDSKKRQDSIRSLIKKALQK
tara:strand:- start:242 stop:430 length:189 start_codon:yes stop_codon:yes gene_type:complete